MIGGDQAGNRGSFRAALAILKLVSVEQQQIQDAIAALESQRQLLGHAVVDASVRALREQLVALVTPPSGESAQRLKQVTVLFLDVVGSTSLSQRLDPEEIHVVMDGALQACTAVVQAHGGQVLQYAGDNLLAAFGADETREDDAERAVRCGLALLDEGRRLGERVLARHGHAGTDFRVGLHTGPVLLGGGVDGEGTIRGIAVNVAARMEQIAPAGSLRISHDTLAFVRGLFEVDPQPPAVVKGVQDPITSVLVRRALPRPFDGPARGIEGLHTPMIGRDAELRRLQEALHGVVSARRLVAVTVVAEAGVGKSRLLREFEAWRHRVWPAAPVLRGRVQPHAQGEAYTLLRDLLAGWLGLADDDTPAAARERLLQQVTPLFAAEDAQAQAHLLGHLIGFVDAGSPHVSGIRDDARQLRDRGFEAATQLLRQLQRQANAPIVLLLEDLHWADDATLDFLVHLGTRCAELPLLIVGLTRPTLFERRPAGCHAPGVEQRMPLAALPRADAERLADELLRPLAAAPVALRELIVSRADGNPYFMEELVRMLMDQRAIEAGPQGWVLHAHKLQPGAVPLTLAGVLQARLDELPGVERAALQDASVIGPVFADAALKAIAETAAAQLPALERRALALPQPGEGAEGWRDYAFRHHLLHQVTYDTVLKRRRRELHARVAMWLAALEGVTAGAHGAVIAGHFEQAGDLANAAEYGARSAEQARQRMATATALQQAEHALALLDALPAASHAPLRWRLQSLRWQCLEMMGDGIEATACSDTMQALADALDDDARRGQVALQRSVIAAHAGAWRDADAAAQTALICATRVGDETLRLRALQRRAVALRSLGNYDSARTIAEQALAEARVGGHRLAQQVLLSVLANIAEESGHPVASLALRHETMALARELGNRRSEIVALGNLGNSERQLGDFDAARQHLQEAVRLMRRADDRAMLCSPLTALALVSVALGEPAQALHHAEEALALARTQGALQKALEAQLVLGEAQFALGQRDAAAGSFEATRASGLAAGNTVWIDAAAGLARVALAAGDAAAAWAAVAPVIAHVEGGASLQGGETHPIEHTCFCVLQQAGDARADAWLQRAHASLQDEAARIDDAALRQRFLQAVAQNAAIVAAWRAHRHQGA